MKAIFVSFNQAYYEMILNVMDRKQYPGLHILERSTGTWK